MNLDFTQLPTFKFNNFGPKGNKPCQRKEKKIILYKKNSITSVGQHQRTTICPVKHYSAKNNMHSLVLLYELPY